MESEVYQHFSTLLRFAQHQDDQLASYELQQLILAPPEV